LRNSRSNACEQDTSTKPNGDGLSGRLARQTIDSIPLS
jgi:hypothetical protein